MELLEAYMVLTSFDNSTASATHTTDNVAAPQVGVAKTACNPVRYSLMLISYLRAHHSRSLLISLWFIGRWGEPIPPSGRREM